MPAVKKSVAQKGLYYVYIYGEGKCIDPQNLEDNFGEKRFLAINLESSTTLASLILLKSRVRQYTHFVIDCHGENKDGNFSFDFNSELQVYAGDLFVLIKKIIGNTPILLSIYACMSDPKLLPIDQLPSYSMVRVFTNSNSLLINHFIKELISYESLSFNQSFELLDIFNHQNIYLPLYLYTRFQMAINLNGIVKNFSVKPIIGNHDKHGLIPYSFNTRLEYWQAIQQDYINFIKGLNVINNDALDTFDLNPFLYKSFDENKRFIKLMTRHQFDFLWYNFKIDKLKSYFLDNNKCLRDIFNKDENLEKEMSRYYQLFNQERFHKFDMLLEVIQAALYSDKIVKNIIKNFIRLDAFKQRLAEGSIPKALNFIIDHKVDCVALITYCLENELIIEGLNPLIWWYLKGVKIADKYKGDIIDLIMAEYENQYSYIWKALFEYLRYLEGEQALDFEDDLENYCGAIEVLLCAIRDGLISLNDINNESTQDELEKLNLYLKLLASENIYKTCLMTGLTFKHLNSKYSLEFLELVSSSKIILLVENDTISFPLLMKLKTFQLDSLIEFLEEAQENNEDISIMEDWKPIFADKRDLLLLGEISDHNSNLFEFLNIDEVVYAVQFGGATLIEIHDLFLQDRRKFDSIFNPNDPTVSQAGFKRCSFQERVQSYDFVIKLREVVTQDEYEKNPPIIISSKFNKLHNLGLSCRIGANLLQDVSSYIGI
jgi:hypothetical protein